MVLGLDGFVFGFGFVVFWVVWLTACSGGAWCGCLQVSPWELVLALIDLANFADFGVCCGGDLCVVGGLSADVSWLV